MAPPGLAALVDGYEVVLVDLDGCVWVGDELTPRADAAIAALRAAGKGVAFLTNDSRASAEDLVRKLWRLGVQAAVREVVTVGAALQHLLAESHPRGGRAVVIGSDAIYRHVQDAGIDAIRGPDLAQRADIVVVGLDLEIDYPLLRDAVLATRAGAQLIATSRDATLPMPDGLWPGTGAVLAAIETASGRRADTVIGKPEPQLFRTARDRLGDGRTLMIGDRVDADLAGAAAAGIDCAIVLTGATSDAEARAAKDPAAVAVAASLADVVLGPGPHTPELPPLQAV